MDKPTPDGQPPQGSENGIPSQEESESSPLQWPQSKRVGHVILVSVLTLVMNLSSTIFTPGARFFAEEYGITNPSLQTLIASIYMLGLMCGPLAIAPLSELYGRLIPYHVSNLIFFGFTIGCAKSTSTGMFLAFRFLAGCAGSAPLTIGGGTIADVIPKEQRGVAMGMFSLGPTLGPSLGPIIGGFVAQYKGWRWTFWVLLILHGSVSLACLIFMRETFTEAPQAGQYPASEQKKITANRLPTHVFLRALLTPIKLLIFHPAVLLTSLSVAYAFGLSFLLFTTFPNIFQMQYGFSLGISGLCYLGMGSGMLVGVAIFSLTSDKLQEWHRRRNFYEPENRLALMAIFCPVIPIGYFWYGWCADKVTHWIVPIIGTSLIGLGTLFTLMPVQLYLIDACGPKKAASALAANTILRSIAAGLLPLAGPPLYDTLGLGWGNSLLGLLAILFIPVPWLLYRYGRQLREWPESRHGDL
ncbi:MFS general substrate transporter [Aspergillus pseudotamarii]|uniref:MFS general substrate transporter n=1 Tax=Aspergillus pseudotamarii TaxID=132259 RepID=A0A5N6ST77_ASPPS|nr:MFS general substrate transporter [Aspergillus pseudotamarii]KAE8137832.1 MFS general substrate transporter [Aspergillus pseudotamarii]